MKTIKLFCCLSLVVHILMSPQVLSSRDDMLEPQKKPQKILIVGGGIGGLALANALQNAAIPYDMIEKKQEWTHEGAGIALPANATYALQQLGFGDEVEENTQHITAMTFTTDQGDLLIREDVTGIHNSGAQFRSIHRADLHEMLFAKLKTPIAMGRTIKVLRQTSPESQVEVQFEDGSLNSYDLVVGADGLHSGVRKLVFGEDQPVYQGIATWRTVVDTPEGLDNPVYMLGDDTVLLLYPLNKSKTYVYCHQVDSSRPADIPEERVSKLQRLFGHYKGLAPLALNQMTEAHKIIPGWLESVAEIKWASGRVLQIGDASHACSPMLQQGGALAIEEGLILSEELKKGLDRGDGILEIIRKFVERRKARVETIVRESDKRIKLLPEVRNQFIQANGAPNVAMFRIIMRENP